MARAAPTLAPTHRMGGGYMRVLDDNGTARPFSPETMRRLAATLSAIRPLVVSDEAAEAVLRSGDFLSFFVWFTDHSLLFVPQEEDEPVVASCVDLLKAVTTAFEQDACFISCVLAAMSAPAIGADPGRRSRRPVQFVILWADAASGGAGASEPVASAARSTR